MHWDVHTAYTQWALKRLVRTSVIMWCHKKPSLLLATPLSPLTLRTFSYSLKHYSYWYENTWKKNMGHIFYWNIRITIINNNKYNKNNMVKTPCFTVLKKCNAIIWIILHLCGDSVWWKCTICPCMDNMLGNLEQMPPCNILSWNNKTRTWYPLSHITMSQRGRACVWFNTFPIYDKHLGANVIVDKQRRACYSSGIPACPLGFFFFFFWD